MEIALVERMAAEVLRLADENRLTQGRSPVEPGVQEYMRAALVRAAERPPSEAEAERDRQIAEALGRDYRATGTGWNHRSTPRSTRRSCLRIYAGKHSPDRHRV